MEVMVIYCHFVQFEHYNIATCPKRAVIYLRLCHAYFMQKKIAMTQENCCREYS